MAAMSPTRAFSLQSDVLQLQGEVQNVRDGLQQTRTEADQMRSEVEQLTVQLRSVFSDLGDVTRQQLSDRAQFEDLTALKVVAIRDEVVHVKEDLKTTIVEAKKAFEENRTQMQGLAQQVREETGRLQQELQQLHAEAAAGWQRHEVKLEGMVKMAKSAEAQQVRDETEGLQRELRQLHADAAAGWQRHEEKLTNMAQEVKQAFMEVQRKISNMEAEGSRGGTVPGPRSGDKFLKGYLPMKTLVPDKLTDKVEEWRRWRTKLLSYLDIVTPGMKKFLEEIQNLDGSTLAKKIPEDEEQWDTWIKTKEAEYGHAWIGADRNIVYRVLQELTTGQALKVVESIPHENGYRAWKELNLNFEPMLAGRQGQALNELQDVTRYRAKDPNETRRLVTELVSKIKVAEEITGEKISDLHARTLLLGLLDETTRQHTTSLHGTGTFIKFKIAVLEFVNNVSSGTGVKTKATPMELGAVRHGHEHVAVPEESSSEDEKSVKTNGEEYYNEYVNAIKGGPNVRCYSCGGKGHIAKNCPRPSGLRE